MHISEDVKAIAGSVLPVLFSARPEHSLYPLFLLLLHLCSIQLCPVDSCMLSVWQVHSGQRWNSCRRNLAAWSAPCPSCWVSTVTVVWKLTRLASFKCHGMISWNSGGLWGTHSLFFLFSTLVAPQPSALFSSSVFQTLHGSSLENWHHWRLNVRTSDVSLLYRSPTRRPVYNFCGLFFIGLTQTVIIGLKGQVVPMIKKTENS